MKFHVTLEQDEDGVYIVECPSLPGCVSQGPTEEAALSSIREAIRACLDVRRERGMPGPLATRFVTIRPSHD